MTPNPVAEHVCRYLKSFKGLTMAGMVFVWSLQSLRASNEDAAAQVALPSGGIRVVNQSQTPLHLFSIWEDKLAPDAAIFLFGTIPALGHSRWVSIPANRKTVPVTDAVWLQKDQKEYQGIVFHDGTPSVKQGEWTEILIRADGGWGGLSTSPVAFPGNELLPGSLGRTRVIQMRGDIANLEKIEWEWQRLLFLAGVEEKTARAHEKEASVAWLHGYYGSALGVVNQGVEIFGRKHFTGFKVALNQQGTSFATFQTDFLSGYAVGTGLLKSAPKAIAP